MDLDQLLHFELSYYCCCCCCCYSPGIGVGPGVGAVAGQAQDATISPREVTSDALAEERLVQIDAFRAGIQTAGLSTMRSHPRLLGSC
jgi:hypothetical protein